ncbi:hypothetical protein PCC79_16195 [Propioniciclava soli]|uniref:ParA family protein n=1 Tax=Propioniciclava soli TaxID=2775081 RepID=A0ABZ3C6K8_9ACTN
MSTVVLASASGAPGVTTTALGLTLAWPRDVLLLDADRSAAHTVLAGYLRGQAPHALGVQGLLQAYRERLPMGEALLANALALPDARASRAAEDPSGPDRRFVPGFTHLGSVGLFDGVWGSLLEAGRGTDRDLVVDAGRLGPAGLAGELAGGADMIGLVCRTTLVSLAALRLHLPPLVDSGPPGRVGLVLVGPGRPYGAREVADQFGVRVLAEIPWEPKAAADLIEAGSLPRNWSRQGLARSYARTAEQLRAAMTEGLTLPQGAETVTVGAGGAA